LQFKTNCVAGIQLTKVCEKITARYRQWCVWYLPIFSRV